MKIHSPSERRKREVFPHAQGHRGCGLGVCASGTSLCSRTQGAPRHHTPASFVSCFAGPRVPAETALPFAFPAAPAKCRKPHPLQRLCRGHVSPAVPKRRGAGPRPSARDGRRRRAAMTSTAARGDDASARRGPGGHGAGAGPGLRQRRARTRCSFSLSVGPGCFGGGAGALTGRVADPWRWRRSV